MKKAFTALSIFTAAIISLPIAGALIEPFGYTFELRYHSCFAVVAALSALSTAFVAYKQPPVKNIGVLLAFLPLLSVFNSSFYIWNINGNAVLVFTSTFVCICSCVYLALHFGIPTLKVACITISAVLVLGLAGIGSVMHVIRVFSEGIHHCTVKYSIESPDGTYVAETIEIDSGAMGGATRVEVRKINGGIDAVVFKISKKPVKVYSGDWGEDPIVYWDDENCLVINSKKHEMH